MSVLLSASPCKSLPAEYPIATLASPSNLSAVLPSPAYEPKNVFCAPYSINSPELNPIAVLWPSPADSALNKLRALYPIAILASPC